jgi:beta-lactamase regulating signal transducer with metallopeptidase domain
MTGLVTWIWQGAIVAAVGALLAHTLPRLNAATRHVIWWVALAMVIVHPWTPSVVPPDSRLAGAGAAATRVLLWLPAPPPWVARAVIAAWVVVACVRLFQLVRGVALLARLKRHSQPFPRDRERRLEMWSSIAQSRWRRTSLRVGEQRSGACALGLWRPVILVPRSLLETLSDADLDLVVMHEHAHLGRYDDWSRVLQCAVAALVGLHPAIWFIGRQIDLEREAACDDHVVARTGAPGRYAQCLMQVAAVALKLRRPNATVIPAMASSTAMLRVRIDRLLDVHRESAPRLKWIATAGSAAALAMAVVGSDRMPPLIAFARADAAAPVSERPALTSAGSLAEGPVLLSYTVTEPS